MSNAELTSPPPAGFDNKPDYGSGLVERRVHYLGNFSAVDPAYSRYMECHECEVSWTGCWDNFQCPKCGEGELPKSGINIATFRLMP